MRFCLIHFKTLRNLEGSADYNYETTTETPNKSFKEISSEQCTFKKDDCEIFHNVAHQGKISDL